MNLVKSDTKLINFTNNIITYSNNKFKFDDSNIGSSSIHVNSFLGHWFFINEPAYTKTKYKIIAYANVNNPIDFSINSLFPFDKNASSYVRQEQINLIKEQRLNLIKDGFDYIRIIENNECSMVIILEAKNIEIANILMS